MDELEVKGFYKCCERHSPYLEDTKKHKSGVNISVNYYIDYKFFQNKENTICLFVGNIQDVQVELGDLSVTDSPSVNKNFDSVKKQFTYNPQKIFAYSTGYWKDPLFKKITWLSLLTGNFEKGIFNSLFDPSLQRHSDFSRPDYCMDVEISSNKNKDLSNVEKILEAHKINLKEFGRKIDSLHEDEMLFGALETIFFFGFGEEPGF